MRADAVREAGSRHLRRCRRSVRADFRPQRRTVSRAVVASRDDGRRSMTIDDAYFARPDGEGTRRKPAAKARRRRSRGSREMLMREDWIATARAALIKSGIG